MELEAGGGDHWNGGGGYSGGLGESGDGNRNIVNGGEMDIPTANTTSGDGGSYFYSHRYDGRSGALLAGKIGGQGGQCNSSNWWCDSGGDGGTAGKGGIITISENSKIYAYNGNRFTDGVTGNEFSESTIFKNQCPIFAQNGILRDVYKMNSWWGNKENYNYTYFLNLFGETIQSNVNSVSVAASMSENQNILVRAEIIENASQKIKNGYQNPDLISKSASERSVVISVDSENQTIDMLYQGVGSGAGYIELSNGTYAVDASLN